MLKEIKTREEISKIQEFYGDDILSVDTTFVDEGEIKGFSSVKNIPVIQLHTDNRHIKELFYSAYGKAIAKAKSLGSDTIFVMCNNKDLAEQLKNREGFQELGFQILSKEV